jgi:hypothetical protein
VRSLNTGVWSACSSINVHSPGGSPNAMAYEQPSASTRCLLCYACSLPAQQTRHENTKRLLLLHVAILLRIKTFDITLHICLICFCFSSLKQLPTVFAKPLSTSVPTQLSSPSGHESRTDRFSILFQLALHTLSSQTKAVTIQKQARRNHFTNCYRDSVRHSPIPTTVYFTYPMIE